MTDVKIAFEKKIKFKIVRKHFQTMRTIIASYSRECFNCSLCSIDAGIRVRIVTSGLFLETTIETRLYCLLFTTIGFTYIQEM